MEKVDSRIIVLDGLRAFAVLGVVLSHVWGFFLNLKISIFGIGIEKIFSFGGVGVDLFFVISGFCMYYMFLKSASNNKPIYFWEFLKKRWMRIAPAFYFVIIFECSILLLRTNSFPIKSFLYHIFFINIFDRSSVLSPPFWSLATEWHFYLLLPSILFMDFKRKWLVLRIAVLTFISILFRLHLYFNSDLMSGLTIHSAEIWYRFSEFGFGILAANYYVSSGKLSPFFRGNLGFIISLLISFLGRLFMMTNFFVKFGKFSFVIRALAEPLMTFGFALMILCLITSKSVFSKIISWKGFVFLGKISYSAYLWHWFIAVNVCYYFSQVFGSNTMSLTISYFTTIGLLIPISILSYQLFESFYFRRNKVDERKR